MDIEGNRESIEYLKPIVREKKVRNFMNVLIAIMGGLFVVMVELFGVYVLNFEFIEATVLGAILVLVYAISLPFLLEPVKVREVRLTAVRTIEKPVVNEIVRTKTVVKPVVKTKTVTKKVVKYKEKKRKMPVAKRYKFVASSNAKLAKDKIYHPVNSTSARMIRPKNRIHSNSEASLKKKGYKPSTEILERKAEARKKSARKAARTRAENAAKKKTKKKVKKKVSKKKTVKKKR